MQCKESSCLSGYSIIFLLAIVLIAIYAQLFSYHLSPCFNRSFASVECTDNGTPPLHSRQTFPVIVTDQNDHAPHFSQYEYMASIDEGNELDVPVLQVDATDMVSDGVIVLLNIHENI